MGWGTGLWGECPWGHCGASVTTAASTNFGLNEANVYSQDLLEVTFTTTVANNDVIKNTNNWRIDLLSSTGNVVSVRSVLVGTSDPGLTRIFLEISPITVGSFYSISFLGQLIGIDGSTLTGTLQLMFKARFTKTDSMLRSRPPIYDLRLSSTYRHVINAIGRQDDIIGGNQEEGEDILPELPPL